MYVYQADTYCDSCGESIRAELLDSQDISADDLENADSDVCPQSAPDDSEVDYPDHCASGEDCLESIDLLAYGLPTVAFAPVLVGAETQRIGALLSDNLTPNGVSYLREMIEAFADYLPEPTYVYVVIENTPGYLPEDDDPATFDNIEDARVYASDLLSRLLDHIYEGQSLDP